MTFKLRAIVCSQLIWDPIAIELSLHCFDHCVGQGVSAEGAKFNIVTVMVDHYNVSIQLEEISTYF